MNPNDTELSTMMLIITLVFFTVVGIYLTSSLVTELQGYEKILCIIAICFLLIGVWGIAILFHGKSMLKLIKGEK